MINDLTIPLSHIAGQKSSQNHLLTVKKSVIIVTFGNEYNATLWCIAQQTGWNTAFIGKDR
ncbi:hypothetical protein FC82_GL000598 [Secundilactobacillus collinoides DSM 20515 = JCM 1123]|uniref:Uncharacterized protein n=1 Tax=Secundilactobacillus collinoides DSM 20515 = JCM 1123 TaxID=1423733 RepID=A0A0R2BE18_SECCO|nr:hypothetical protein FC82_GL000598 [Secundilactobacillus collinoides DSM 20515 = JCM 1123]